MTFLSPWRLLFVILVAALLIGYLIVQRQRKKYALRFSSVDMFDGIVPDRPGLRTHLPAILTILALLGMVLGFAQPARSVQVPRERATVIVAIDVSLSMEADDVSPTRIEAAQTAATTFIEGLPPTLNVGVVSFAGTASVLLSPSTDRESAINTISGLELAERTAVGESIFTSLEAIKNVPVDADGNSAPAVIIVLSDGETTAGRSDSLAAEAAVEAGVPVSTISFGTPFGSIIYDDPTTPEVENAPINVPVNESSLRTVSDATDGTFFSASSLDELNSVYDDIGSAIGFETEEQEVTEWFLGASILLMTLAATLNLFWFQRLP